MPIQSWFYQAELHQGNLLHLAQDVGQVRGEGALLSLHRGGQAGLQGLGHIQARKDKNIHCGREIFILLFRGRQETNSCPKLRHCKTFNLNHFAFNLTLQLVCRHCQSVPQINYGCYQLAPPEREKYIKIQPLTIMFNLVRECL